MKRVIAAGIVRTLEFDREAAFYGYIDGLKLKNIRHKVNWKKKLPDGRIWINITTAYNGSPLIEDKEDENGEQE